MHNVDISRARAHLQRRKSQKAAELHERYLCAQKDAAAIIRMIRDRYRPRRIWQWGSLLDESRFSEISDIDIAVEEVGDAETFFKCAGEARAMTELPLDSIEIEKIAPEFRNLITTYGTCVYDRKTES